MTVTLLNLKNFLDLLIKLCLLILSTFNKLPKKKIL